MSSTITEEQKNVVFNTSDSLFVESAPGSGKTRTAVTKLWYLLNKKNISSDSLLAITFTNDAAKEMKIRLKNTLKSDVADKVNIKTFHAYALELLYKYPDLCGITPATMIADDAKIKEFFSEFDDNTVKVITNFISRAKDLGSEDKPSFEKAYDERCRIPYDKMVEYFNSYQQYLSNEDLIDFSDVIIKANKLLRDYPEETKAEQHYKFIILDEAQDTNQIQLSLLRKVRGNALINAFGDIDQSIYKWRGAEPELVKNFMKEIGAKTYTLSRTFRCTQEISNIAAILQGALTKQDCREKMNSEGLTGNKPLLYPADSREEELSYIADKIKECAGRENAKLKYEDIVVQARTNAEVDEIENILKKKGIPAKRLQEGNPYCSPEVRSLFSFFNVASGIQSKNALFDVLKNLGFSNNEIEFAKDKDVKMKDIFALALSSDDPEKVQKVQSIRQIFIDTYTALRENTDIKAALDIFFNKVEQLSNKKPISEQVKQSIYNDFGSLSYKEVFRNYAAVIKEAVVLDKSNTVKVTTEHGVKGLEWNTVFVTGLSNDNLERHYKHQDAIDRSAEIEERNLLYVAMTRAKENLYLTYNRRSNEKEKSVPCSFLSRIGYDKFRYEKGHVCEFCTDRDLVENRMDVAEKTADKVPQVVMRSFPDFNKALASWIPKRTYAWDNDQSLEKSVLLNEKGNRVNERS